MRKRSLMLALFMTALSFSESGASLIFKELRKDINKIKENIDYRYRNFLLKGTGFANVRKELEEEQASNQKLYLLKKLENQYIKRLSKVDFWLSRLSSTSFQFKALHEHRNYDILKDILEKESSKLNNQYSAYKCEHPFEYLLSFILPFDLEFYKKYKSTEDFLSTCNHEFVHAYADSVLRLCQTCRF